MSYYLRKGIWYVVTRPQGRYGHVKHLRLPESSTEEDAKRIDLTLKAAIREKRKSSSKTKIIDKGTIKDLWSEYHRYIMLHRKQRTAADVEDTGKHIIKILGNINVADLNQYHITLFKELRKKDKGRDRKSTISNRTINKNLAWLSGFLKWCRKYTEIEIPDIEIENLPAERPIPVILSMQECKDILNNLAYPYKGFVACLYLLGLRLSEVQRLRKEDFDMNNNVVYIKKTKSGLPKVLGIPDWLKTVLQEAPVNEITRNSPYMFPSKVTGGVIYNIRHALRKACEKANVTKKVYPHLFRHSIASHLLELNYSTRAIQSFLGHQQISQTEWYAQVGMNTKREIAFTLDNLLNR